MKLTVSIDIDGEEEYTVEFAKKLLREMDDMLDKYTFHDSVKCALTRDNDRSGGNLLLPKLSGRVGEHYQGRKASLKEVLDLGH